MAYRFDTLLLQILAAYPGEVLPGIYMGAPVENGGEQLNDS
jgi:hypothetical protein